MVDLPITSGQVLADLGFSSKQLTASEAINAGEAVYETSGRQAALAESGVSAVEADALGLALNTVATGQPCTIAIAGDIDVGAGASPPAGVTYIVSVNRGRVAPDADGATGQFKKVLGVGIGSNKIRLGGPASGVASA